MVKQTKFFTYVRQKTKTKTKIPKKKQSKCLNVLLLIFNCIKFVFGEIVVLSFNFIYNYYIAVINVDNTYKCCVSFSVCLFSSNYIYIAFKFSFYFFKNNICIFNSCRFVPFSKCKTDYITLLLLCSYYIQN